MLFVFLCKHEKIILKKAYFKQKGKYTKKKSLEKKKRSKKRDAPIKRCQEKVRVEERNSPGKLQPRKVADLEVGR